MKQTLEEAARQEVAMNNSNDVYGGKSYSSEMMIRMFIAGAEWQAKQSPWISVEERLPEEDGYCIVTDGTIIVIAYYFKEWNKFAQYKAYPHPFYEEWIIKAYLPVPNFKQV